MHVIIVGAGPAGAATALLLARKSVEVTLIERATDFSRVFRGEGLMPSGIDALLQMGLGHVLASLPQRKLESWDIYLDGQETIVIPEPIEELGERAVRVAPQPELLHGIIDQAKTHSCFTFLSGAAVRDVLWDDNRVTGVRIETDGRQRDVLADFVIACDGRGSLLRTRARLELDRLPEDYDIVWCKLPAPDRLRDACRFMMLVAEGVHPAVCYTSWDGRLQYGLILPKGGWQKLQASDWLEQAARPAPDWLAEHLLASREQIEGPLHLNVMVGRCPRWSVPGLLLLGDAAHPMSPVRAQGINVALRDAIVAANHLGPPLRDGCDAATLDAAAREVQKERDPEIIRSQTLQHREARGQAVALAGGWRYRLAKSLAGILGRYRWVQRLWLYKQRDLRFGSTDVRLRD